MAIFAPAVHYQEMIWPNVFSYIALHCSDQTRAAASRIWSVDFFMQQSDFTSNDCPVCYFTLEILVLIKVLFAHFDTDHH